MKYFSMNRLIKTPDSTLSLFATLCLCQVREQLFSNLTYHYSNPCCFVYGGHLFAFTHTRSLIPDELTTGFNASFN
jgi:hypothetical protein